MLYPKKAEINQVITEDYRRLREFSLGNTTHLAKSAVRIAHGKKLVIYARGFIIDGRAGHHKALFLDDWHMVKKNNEAAIKVSRDQRAAAMRRRLMAWD